MNIVKKRLIRLSAKPSIDDLFKALDGFSATVEQNYNSLHDDLIAASKESGEKMADLYYNKVCIPESEIDKVVENFVNKLFPNSNVTIPENTLVDCYAYTNCNVAQKLTQELESIFKDISSKEDSPENDEILDNIDYNMSTLPNETQDGYKTAITNVFNEISLEEDEKKAEKDKENAEAALINNDMVFDALDSIKNDADSKFNADKYLEYLTDGTDVGEIAFDIMENSKNIVGEISNQLKEYAKNNNVEDIDNYISNLKNNNDFVLSCAEHVYANCYSNMLKYIDSKTNELLANGVDKARIDGLKDSLKYYQDECLDADYYISTAMSDEVERAK